MPRNQVLFRPVIAANVCMQQVVVETVVYNEGIASWYGFESCENPYCLQANTVAMVEGDNGMACSSEFELGDKVSIRYRNIEHTFVCTDRGGFEVMGRTFDLHKWNFEKFENLSKGLILVTWIKL